MDVIMNSEQLELARLRRDLPAVTSVEDLLRDDTQDDSDGDVRPRIRVLLDDLVFLAAGQNGMFTTAQAVALYERDDRQTAKALYRLRDDDRIVKHHERGLWEIPGAAAFRARDVYAVWLAAIPQVPAAERIHDPGVVVAGVTAAFVHGIGDLQPQPWTFAVRDRSRCRRVGVSWQVARDLTDDDVVITDHGLPVTGVARTIRDMVMSGFELGHVGDAVVDAINGGLVTRDELIAQFQNRELAQVRSEGYPVRGGEQLLELLIAAASRI
jgi:hypothetical protein